MKELYVLGASGHGKVVSDVAKSMKKYKKIRFFDDAAEDIISQNKITLLIEGNTEKLIQFAKDNPEAEVIIAVGNNRIRKKIQSRMEQENLSVATLVHAGAVVSDEVRIGAGTVVMPGAVINSGAVIGKGCIINTSCSVDHDNWIGDYCHISVGSHLAGTVKVGEETFIGAGAVVKNNVDICEGCLIGAGAVVVSNIKVPGTYMGIPAKLQKTSME